MLFRSFLLVILMALWFVSDEAKKSNQQCYDAGGLIVQTDKGWRCVEAK